MEIADYVASRGTAEAGTTIILESGKTSKGAGFGITDDAFVIIRSGLTAA